MARVSGEGGQARATAGDDTYRRIEDRSPSPAALAPLAGVYRSPELDAAWTLDADEDGLAVTLPDGERLALRPGTDEEYFGEVSLSFQRGPGGVTGFLVYAGRVTGIEFQRLGDTLP